MRLFEKQDIFIFSVVNALIRAVPNKGNTANRFSPADFFVRQEWDRYERQTKEKIKPVWCPRITYGEYGDTILV